MGEIDEIFVDHDYSDQSWIGIVTNVDDPTFSGRCQVKVYGLFDGIKNEHLPWAIPLSSTVFGGDGAGSLSIPKLGQFVRIQFNNGDVYAPEYMAIQNIDTELISTIKDDYQGTHVLLHDPEEQLLVIFQKQRGFQIFHKDSFIQITPDTLITLQTPDNSAIIQMDGDTVNITTKNEVNIAAAAKAEVTADEVVVNGAQTTKVGSGPYFHAILAEPLWALLTTLATAIDAKLPLTPGVNVGVVESVKSAATSTNVLIGK
jgi:hypothetical protein